MTELERCTRLVEKHRDEILQAERYIWAHPETGFQEWNTSSWLGTQFEQAGYSVRYAGDIPGFFADLDTGRPGPRVLILAELDALLMPNHPEAVNGRAHACGHHAQCAALLGIALALREPGALEGLSGSVRLMAVPAEEMIEVELREQLRKQGKLTYLGGKAEFLRRGFLDGVDLAYLFHTGVSERFRFTLGSGSNGCVTKTVTFHGKAAHAGGQPHLGVNALYAASEALSALNALRETFRDEDHIRIHPILTESGSSVNIIPDRAVLSSYVRGASIEAIAEADRKFTRALAAGALALGAEVHCADRPAFAPLLNDPVLSEIGLRCMRELAGEDQVDPNEGWSTGSTDMGDLSCIMPVIHPNVSGARGPCHGDTFRIVDPENACVRSAQCQYLLLRTLLRDGAAEARRVLGQFVPRYPSKEAYFQAMDAQIRDRDLVTYGTDGAAVRF